MCCFFFFFSSRRRHTRFKCDWSSDVCSSDLRHQKISTLYLPQGGTLNDGGVKADFWLGTAVMLSGSVQYEKWNYPVLDPLPRSNVTTSIQFTFWPRSWK